MPLQKLLFKKNEFKLNIELENFELVLCSFAESSHHFQKV